MGIDYFSVAWTGEVEAPATGEYIFTIAADEGAQLFLDGKAIVDTAPRRDGREVGSAPTRLEAGTKHPLKLVYFDWAGNARVRLLWSGPGLPKSVIPKDRLFASGALPAHAADLTGKHGLLGTYYKDAEFGSPTVTRVDPLLDFYWSDRDPLPGFSRTNFSVRWSGQIKADHSEEYTFYVFANDRVRLWVDDKLVIDRMDQAWLAETRGSLPLVAGEKYDLRLQVQSRSTYPAAKLLWSSASIARTNIPATHLFPSRPTPTRGPSIDTAGDKTPPGLVLRNGAFLAGAVESATETSIRAAGPLRGKPLSAVQVARIICQPMPKAMESRITAHRPGVLLAKGDYVDGEFRGLENGRVKLSSVLFGTRSFDTQKEVLAIVLREVAPEPASHEILLRDQSSLPCGSVVFERDSVVATVPPLGSMRFSDAELATLKRRPPPARGQ